MSAAIASGRDAEMSAFGRAKLSETRPAEMSAFGREKISGRAVDALDLRRLKLGLSIQVLADAAGISARTYRRLMGGRGGRVAVHRIRDALARLERSTPSPEETSGLILATYGGFLAAYCRARGLDPAAAHAQDPRACTTGSPAWRDLAHARQAAMYLTNTALALPQRRLAMALGLTPAAICLALRSVEQRRDDREFDRLLDRLAGDVMGVMP